MSMIIAGNGSASVYTGSGRATVHFTASGTGRATGASVATTVNTVQNAPGCSGGSQFIPLSLAAPTTPGGFLAACVTLTDGATVQAIYDRVEGYDTIVASLNPVAWWRYNESGGNIAYDSGSGGNNGIGTGSFTVGVPGPILGDPLDTAWQFASAATDAPLLGVGLLGQALLGEGANNLAGQVALTPATDIQFGTNSFSIAGWINGTADSGGAYIFNNIPPIAAADVAQGALGWAMRGRGIMGGGLLSTTAAGFALQMNAGTNQLEFQVADIDGNGVSVITPQSYADAWHFVVGVVDRTAELLSLYVDGDLIGDVSIVGIASVTNTSVIPTMADGLAGDISQVFMTNYALTAAQVALLYSDSAIVSMSNRWIQAAYSYNEGYGSEIWYARGIKGGPTLVTVQLSIPAPACANLSEWAGIWYVDPLDQWSQNFGSGEPAATLPVQPRAGSELFLAAVSSAEGQSGFASGGYLNLTTGGTGNAAYYISPYTVAETTSWEVYGPAAWAVCHASFVSGDAGFNPDFQFPETLVEISTTTNYLAPLQGYGVWTNISRYVEAMDLGPLGRQHLLDRIDATTADFTLNGRDGSFNVWNTESFLYANGAGLKPMNPMKVSTATFLGETQNNFYGYIQAVTPKIKDVLNNDVAIACNDILALLNLKYLSNNNYAQLLLSGG